jgi:hypothetical protein
MSQRRRKAPGSFQDLERLLEHLGTPLLIELGKPVPDDKHVPRRRTRKSVGRCPAAHNRALIGEDLH